MIKQKIKPRPIFVKARVLLIRLIIISAIIFIALFFVVKYLKEGLRLSGYFKIKDIIVSQAQGGFDFYYLKGRNIFDVDLKQEASYISELYPAYSKIRLVRILPNRLYVGLLIRKPLAYVKLHRYFYIDEEMVLLDMQKVEEETLPLILGLETKISRPTAGEPYNIKELKVALDIIKEAKKNVLLRDYRIKKIDLINPANSSFFVVLPFAFADYPGVNSKAKAGTQDLEVRLGEDNISDKMRILSGIFMNLKNDLSKIQYIDLRFKEPVIKFNEGKS